MIFLIFFARKENQMCKFMFFVSHGHFHILSDISTVLFVYLFDFLRYLKELFFRLWFQEVLDLWYSFRNCPSWEMVRSVPVLAGTCCVCLCVCMLLKLFLICVLLCAGCSKLVLLEVNASFFQTVGILRILRTSA